MAVKFHKPSRRRQNAHVKMVGLLLGLDAARFVEVAVLPSTCQPYKASCRAESSNSILSPVDSVISISSAGKSRARPSILVIGLEGRTAMLSLTLPSASSLCNARTYAHHLCMLKLWCSTRDLISHSRQVRPGCQPRQTSLRHTTQALCPR
ncbi:hypothetical protein IE81DRAFT_178444 [Ceraceosorus guamensis]|uniref:Uncharacterized protein n=1 Tax=Ceraceosorus guamensis TaxID=1522189 RepID=A0A316VVP5_9BASI|nr:hypothetical protein IE81DRAFT_178444 [Ceraceosorus guamensis]PWN41364.1 hypothetical protein IE81DRAFT_178444 [Ceraceosorus guamensis]